MAALGVSYEALPLMREVGTLSGGERSGWWSRLCCGQAAEVPLLDEPDETTSTSQESAGSSSSSAFHAQDGAAGQRRPGNCWPKCAERIVTVEDGSVWRHGGGFATYAQARRDRIERLDELRRRWDEEHEKAQAAGPACTAEGVLQRRDGSLPGCMRPRQGCASSRRPGRPSCRRATRTCGCACAAAGPASGGDLRDLEAHRAHAAFQRGGLVRRAGRRARPQRLRQVLLPAAARRREVRHEGTARLGAGSCPGCSRRPTRARTWPAAGRRDPHDRARDAAQRGDGRARRYELQYCARQAFDSLSGGQQDGCRSCLLELALLDRCRCSTSQPTTSTWPARRHCRQAWSRSRAPCWPSRTTAGSPSHSTGSWCSAGTGTSMRLTAPSGTRLALPGPGDRPLARLHGVHRA